MDRCVDMALVAGITDPLGTDRAASQSRLLTAKRAATERRDHDCHILHECAVSREHIGGFSSGRPCSNRRAAQCRAHGLATIQGTIICFSRAGGQQAGTKP